MNQKTEFDEEEFGEALRSVVRSLPAFRVSRRENSIAGHVCP